MMKRILALLLAAVMVFALAACGGGENDETDIPNQNTGSGNESSYADHPLLSTLCGEWKNVNHDDINPLPYSNIMIRSDGTCLVDGKSATWKISDSASREDKLEIEIYLGGEYFAGAAVTANGFCVVIDKGNTLASQWARVTEAIQSDSAAGSVHSDPKDPGTAFFDIMCASKWVCPSFGSELYFSEDGTVRFHYGKDEQDGSYTWEYKWYLHSFAEYQGILQHDPQFSDSYGVYGGKMERYGEILLGCNDDGSYKLYFNGQIWDAAAK